MQLMSLEEPLRHTSQAMAVTVMASPPKVRCNVQPNETTLKTLKWASGHIEVEFFLDTQKCKKLLFFVGYGMKEFFGDGCNGYIYIYIHTYKYKYILYLHYRISLYYLLTTHET